MTIKKNSKEKKQIDTLFQSLFLQQKLRCAIVITTDTLKVAKEKHNLDPMATIALGRALSCAALLGSTLKNEQHYLNCTFDGDGPLRSVTAEFIAPSALRGFVAVPQLNQVLTTTDPIPQTVGEALGPTGQVQIRKGSKTGEHPYTGIAEFATGEIAEDIAQYLLDSEQIASVVGASVKLDKDGNILASGGILIQKLGGVELDPLVLDNIENKISQELNLTERIMNGESPEEIFAYFTGETASSNLYSTSPLGFYCFCSREKMTNTLMGLGESELRKIQQETGKLEIKCQYCSTVHQFNINEFIKH